MPLLLGLTLNCELVCFYGKVLKIGMSKETLIASLKKLDVDTDREEGNFFYPHLILGCCRHIWIHLLFSETKLEQLQGSMLLRYTDLLTGFFCFKQLH
jgi:hypothetical protein